jgi:NNP family nitrate/nitrite transporter-like MFS transporter
MPGLAGGTLRILNTFLIPIYGTRHVITISTLLELFPIIFAHSARQGAGVIGWTSAIAAYGPIIWSVLIGLSITKTGNPAPFFYGITVYYLIATAVNWYYYQHRGAKKPS